MGYELYESVTMTREKMKHIYSYQGRQKSHKAGGQKSRKPQNLGGADRRAPCTTNSMSNAMHWGIVAFLIIILGSDRIGFSFYDRKTNKEIEHTGMHTHSKPFTNTSTLSFTESSFQGKHFPYPRTRSIKGCVVVTLCSNPSSLYTPSNLRMKPRKRIIAETKL